MKTMLIAAGSKIITEELTRTFLNEYKVYTCSQGDETLLLLQDLRPDILIINLSLSPITGLSVLQRTNFTPPVIIALTTYLSDFVLQAAQNAGVGALIRLPCTIDCIVTHLNKLLSIQ